MPHARRFGWMAWLLLGLAGWGAAGPAHGQTPPEPPAERYTLMLRGVSLERALEEIAAAAEISLVYDAALTEGRRAFCTAREATAEELLRCVLSGAGLDFYRTSAGTYVLTDAPRQAPRYGALMGVVVDGRTGEPLPAANVLLADASTGAATNAAGQFSFSKLLPGPHRLVVTYVGYETAMDSVWVPPGGQTRERVTLKAAALPGTPVVIRGLQERVPSRGLGRGVRAPRDLAALDGAAGTADVARSVAGGVLGTTLQRPRADLYVQGGAANEQRTTLDGVPLWNPVTLGRLLSAFSPLALRRLTLHKAGFGAAEGSHLAGVAAAEHALGTGPEEHVRVVVDPLSVNVRASGRIAPARGPEVAAMVAARRSMADVYRAPYLDELLRAWGAVDPLVANQQIGFSVAPLAERPPETDVAFSDVHAAARVRVHPFHSVYASGYRGTNALGAHTAALAPNSDAPNSGVPGSSAAAAVQARDRYDWTNLAGQVRYEGLLSARVMGTLQVRGSRHRTRHAAETAPADGALPAAFAAPHDANAVSEAAATAEVTYNATARRRLRAALEGVRTTNRFRLGDPAYHALDQAHASWRWAGYAEAEWTPTLRLTVDAGTRLTYVPGRQTLYAEPRAALRYDAAASPLGPVAVRLAGGLYRQFVNAFDLSNPGPTALVPFVRFWLPTDATLAPPRAVHAAADVLLTPAAHWSVSLEAYHKWMPHLLALDYDALVRGEVGGAAVPLHQQTGFIAGSRGRAYGAGLHAAYEAPRLTAALRYDVSRSRRTAPGRFGGRRVPAPWSEPHRLTLQAEAPLAGPVQGHLQWRGAWGRPWAFRQPYYDYLTAHDAPTRYGPYDLSDPAAQRLAPFYRLDAGLSLRRTWAGVTVEARGDLVNVLSRANAFDWALRPDGARYEKVVRTLPGRRFLFSLGVAY